MDWLTLDSKMLASVAYDAEKRILYLRFRSGDVYRYLDFPGENYKEFLNADSRGKHFLANIRHQFRYERMAKFRVA
ncbi:MAG: KTSC domain-containing protein [Bryobacteraceae bacterium]